MHGVAWINIGRRGDAGKAEGMAAANMTGFFAHDTAGGPGTALWPCRVLRWRYCFEPMTAPSPTTKYPAGTNPFPAMHAERTLAAVALIALIDGVF